MERRSLAPLILGAAGLALVIAIGVLVVKVRAGAPAPEVDPGEVARAQARGAAMAPRAQQPPTPPPLDRPRIPEPAADEPPAPEPAQGGIGELAKGPELAGADVATKMTESNRLYDRGDYEAARAIAHEVLGGQPDNVKMLRIAASSSCYMGEAQRAREYYDRLPAKDQEQISRRCRKFGIEF
jgi:hypothetical protein